MPEQLDLLVENALAIALERPNALLQADTFKRAAFEHQLVEVHSYGLCSCGLFSYVVMA